MGTMDMMVEATPVVVFCMANKEKDTPKNGPKKAPREVSFIADLFFMPESIFGQAFKGKKSTVKPTIPAKIRIWVAAKAS